MDSRPDMNVYIRKKYWRKFPKKGEDGNSSPIQNRGLERSELSALGLRDADAEDDGEEMSEPTTEEEEEAKATKATKAAKAENLKKPRRHPKNLKNLKNMKNLKNRKRRNQGLR